MFFYPKLKCYVILLWLNEATQTEIAYTVAGSSEWGNELTE